MKSEKKDQQGSILLETSLVLPVFILLIVSVYSIFMIVYAQNTMTHALIQATDSLALDSYLNSKVESVADANTVWDNLGSMVADVYRSSKDDHFCYTADKVSPTGAKKRFIGYLAGGDDEAAKKQLEAMGVVNGLSGLSFTVTQTDEDITVTVKYELKFLIDFFADGKIPMSQSITAKLWS